MCQKADLFGSAHFKQRKGSTPMHYAQELLRLPIWFLASALTFIAIGALHVIRRYVEGAPYNFALSSEVGDIGIVMIILIGTTVFQRGVSMPEWMLGSAHQTVALVAAVVASVVFLGFTPTSHQHADFYHHIVIAPVMVLFLVITVPVILWCGTWVELGGGLVGAAVWIFFIWDDVVSARLEQLNWLRTHVHLLVRQH